MRMQHLVLAAVSVTFAIVFTRALRRPTAHEPAAVQRVPPVIVLTAADMPGGLDVTVERLSNLLEAGDAEEALRSCWAPSNLEQMSRSGAFNKCAELVKEDKKLPSTLQRMLAVGPTKTYKTQEGWYYAEFDEHRPDLTSMRFVYVNNHWYVS
jgi:hypothetical protein